MSPLMFADLHQTKPPMDWEWLLFALLVLGALAPFSGKLKRLGTGAWLAVILVAVASLIGAKAWSHFQNQRHQSRAAWQRHIPQQGRPDNYISSDHCKACHEGEFKSWHQSFHRSMTQLAGPDSVVGDFDNVELTAHGEQYIFERRGDEYWVNMPDPDWKARESGLRQETDWSKLVGAPRVDKRITLVTGSHNQQKYWVATENGNLQYDLPFTWLIADRRWVTREDSIVRDPALPGLIQIWNLNCIKCHTTGPQPRLDYSTRTMDTRVGEMGIACEACHGPAEEHVRFHRQPVNRYASHWKEKADPTIVNPKKLSHSASTQVCGQCHSTKITLERTYERDGSAYRPGGNLHHSVLVILPNQVSQIPGLEQSLEDTEMLSNFFWSDGMTRLTGREYNSLLQTPCHVRGEMSCLSCHSMHQSDPDDQLFAGMESNQACLQCHESFRDNLAQHTRHAPDSSGSLCYNCHMPHTSWGLLKAIRTHQITNPTVQSTLETGRPNACNLCHLDQTLGWTAKHLSDWYGTPIPPLRDEDQKVSLAVRLGLSGDAAQRALISWHLGWEAAQQASGRAWMAPVLSQLLLDPYSAVRYRAHHSLRTIPGFESFQYDFVGPEAGREEAHGHAMRQWENQKSTEALPGGGTVLLDDEGQLLKGEFEAYLKKRDDRSIFIIE